MARSVASVLVRLAALISSAAIWEWQTNAPLLMVVLLYGVVAVLSSEPPGRPGLSGGQKR